jgi:uncharacterized membrane protein
MSTNALERFMASVRAGVADLSSEPAEKALEYCQEFISEALEAGRSEEEILKRLGSPEQIVAHVRAEAALSGAESSPGPLRLITARRNVLRALADSAAKASLVLASTVPLTLAYGLYILAVAALIGAILWAGLMGFGVTTMPAMYVREMIGVAGVAVMGAALLALMAVGLWRAADAMNRVTLRILKENLRKGRPGGQPDSAQPHAGRAGRLVLACALAALAGIGMLIASGLPMRYFSIWNSARPESLAVRAWSYPVKEVRGIEVETLNTNIVIEAAKTPAPSIQVTYEEPEWMVGESSVRDGTLVFRETSRGMLPFMEYIARHPGVTVVRIAVPRGHRALDIEAKTTGGEILVGGRRQEGGAYAAGPSTGRPVGLDGTEGGIVTH